MSVHNDDRKFGVLHCRLSKFYEIVQKFFKKHKGCVFNVDLQKS